MYIFKVNKHATRRIFPVPAEPRQNQSIGTILYPQFGPGGVTLTDSNKRMGRWFQGKCNIDINWCN